VGEDSEGLGDPTETALLVAARQAGIDVRRERAAHERLAAIPFDSQRQLMATLHRRTGGGATLYAKGAPEALLERCAGGDAAGVRRVVERLANEGQRVLLVAARAEPAPEEPIESALHDLRVLGLIAMVDPLRPEARRAVADCHRAGVRVLMVTGDHPATARAIGRALDLDQADVHARVAPEDKLRLVRSLQADGEVVAVTGDGVNDAPALRQADIGVAMGRGGTAAAKEAADMVLADDNFATLRAAIEEGRRVYDNLVKALAFVLPTSVGQALIIAVAVLAFPLEHGDPLMPIEPVQVLWINLIVAVALALPLAFEAREPHLMSRGPRARGASLLDRPLLVRTVLVGVTLTIVALTLFALEHQRQLAAGVPDDLALARSQTAAVTGAVLLQALYLLTCRSLVHSNRELGRWSNPTVQIGIALVLALQALYVFAPFMHEIFGSARIDARALAAGAAGALIILPVTWLEERWRRRSLRTR
jgi:magnesium-transporting ATPase (P-type)